MSKISTYEVVPVPKLADKLIGTSVGGEIEDVTYNFTLQELLTLFIPYIPANNLQGVLDFGNTATQDINLFGTITTTNLDVTDTANLFITYLNEEAHIVGGLFDSADSIGLAGQVLTSTGEFVEWVTLPPIFTPNLQQVLEIGNTADIDIVLDANIEALDVNTNTATINTNIIIDGTITDEDAAVGAAGNVLSSTATGVKWVPLPVYSATSPLLFNSATGVFSIQQATNFQDGYLSSTDWITFNGKQNAGNYITALTGEVTASGPGSATATVGNAAVIGKVLTGFNPTAGTINASDSILTAFGKTQSQINALVGGVQYQGVWNASTNVPTLTSSVGVQGHYYVVNVAGTTNLNGITDWQIGDWAIFSESTWQKVDNSESVSSVNGFTGAVSLTTDNIPEGSTNLYFLNSRARLALSATSPLGYDNSTGVFSIQQASGSQNGYLSSTDWTTFNNKQNYLGGTGLVKSSAGTISYITDNSANWNTAYNDSIISAAVTGTTSKTLTLTQQDAGTITASWTDLGLTSVGVSMPSAFNVANSPLTANGTIAITGAGVASQYIRGDGSLANFPTNGGGGGGSVSYYLNGSVNQGTFGGNTYYEMSKIPIIGTGTDFSINADGYISQFITDVGDPALLNIPAGNWNLEMYFSASSGGGSPSFYVELYKYDGVVFTLIASSSATPEAITGGTAIDLYATAVAVPATALTITDRLAIRVYVNHSGRTITLHTENSHLCEVITTFSTGITALNGLTTQVQYLATGTSGTDFNISSTTDTHTFNIPSASATARGLITTGSQIIAGAKSFETAIKLKDGSATGGIGYVGVGSNAEGLTLGIYNGGTVYFQDLFFPITNGYQYTFPATTGTIALTSNLSSYVPYTGATTNVNLGVYDLTSNAVYSKNIIATSNGLTSGNFLIQQSTGSSDPAVGYSLISSSGNFFDFKTTVGSGANVKKSRFDLSGLTSFTTRTYTLPDADGTIALVGGAGVGTVTSVAALTLGTTGTDLSSSVANSTTTPVITLNVPTASAANRGALSSADWTTFNGKQGALTLTTTGTSGAATLVGNTLNIPQYSGGGGGGMAIGGSITSATAGSVLFAGASGVLAQDNANFFWDDTNNRLGLGTTSPSQKLEVYMGNIAMNGTTSNNPYIGFNEAGTPVGYIQFIGTASGISGRAGSLEIETASSSGPIAFRQGVNERMRIDASGNIGFSTNTIGSKVQINGNVAIGYSASTAAPTNGLLVAGDINSSATGSSTTTPRTIGITNLGASTAARIQFGDEFNSFQNANGGMMQIRSYHAMQIYGGRANTATPFVTSVSSTDPSLNVIGTEINRPTLVVTAGASQSANIQQWRNSGGTVLASMSNAGSITANSFVKSGGTSAQILAADGSVITAGTNITISGGTISSTGGGGGSISLAAIGSTPNANAATLTGSVLNLEPASDSFGGVVTTGTQTFAGLKTFSSTGRFSFKTAVNTDASLNIGDAVSVATDTNRAKIVISNTSGGSELILGQSGTNNLLFNWTYNATAANAYGVLETYAGNNNLVIQSGAGKTGFGTTTVGSKVQINGNVAIGYSASTAAPTNGMFVLGNVTIGGNTDNQGPLDVFKSNSGGLGGHIIVRNNGASVGNEEAILFVDGDVSVTRAAISSTTEGSPFFGDIKFKTGNSAYASLNTRMIITGSGNLGLGTTTIGSKFQINGNAAIGYSASTAAPTNGLAVSGNVGVGTSSPDAIFHVAKATTGGLGGQVVIDNPAASSLGNNVEISFLTDGGASGTATRNGRIRVVNENQPLGSSNMQFWTWNGSADAERMRITSGGDIGIGTTTIGSKFQVNGNAAIGYSASTAAPTNGLAVSGDVSFGGFITSSNTNKALNIINQGVEDFRGVNVYQHSNGVQAPISSFYKSRGTSASPTAVASGDIAAAIIFKPYIGAGYAGDRSLFGASMTSSTGISMYFIAGSTDGNYTPNLLVAHNGNVTVGNLGSGTIITSLTLPTSKLQVAGNAAIGYTTATAAPTNGLAVAGIVNTASRVNVNGAGDNSLFSLNNNGTTYTVGFSPTATASSATTLTITTGQTTLIYNGIGAATWTLPNPSGTNQMFWIKNAGTGIITLNAFSGTNIIDNTATPVTSITIATGATALIQQDGNVRSYQLQ